MFGFGQALPSFPARRELRGVGLSDSETYAGLLREKFDYTNTYFHTEPRLDITDVRASRFKSLDFLIASDVFEHVCPPVSHAFSNARQLLRSGGWFIFSVPYVTSGSTREHFPELFEYKMVRAGGRYSLSNTTRDGRLQRFDDLVFHGGPGSTLEMRLFTLEDLMGHFAESGFEAPRLLSDHVPEFGLDWRNEHCSIPMLARAV